jgi:hypothetical protein
MHSSTDDDADRSDSRDAQISRLKRLWVGASWGYSRRWEWRLAWFIDLLHIPIAGCMFTGAAWMPVKVYAIFMGITLALQATVLGCPLMVLTRWLRRRVDPTFIRLDGFVARTYRHHGRVWGLLMLVPSFALGAVILWVSVHL